MTLQHAFNRIDVAADIACEARNRFVTPDVYGSPANGVPPAIRSIQDLSQRLSILQLTMRSVIRACSIELKLDVKREGSSVSAEDLPGNTIEAAELVTRFATDAERAYDDLADILAERITESDKFYACMSDLLQHLDPTNGDYWRMVSRTVPRANGYNWTFVNSLIEGPVAVLSLLSDIKENVPSMSEQLKLDQWIASAVERLYQTAAATHASSEAKKKDGKYKSSDEELIGQAVARIWKYDPDYKDTRSWFPPTHYLRAFHLPGKPQLLHEHALPGGRVMSVAFLPWGYDTLVVGMRTGELLFFDYHHEAPIGQVNGSLEPRYFEYTNYGLMVHGANVYGDRGSVRQWLVLSSFGKCLQDEVITDRTPTQAELDHVESLGRWKRKRELETLSSCNIVIREGLVPYPSEDPGYFTLARIGQRFREKCPNMDTQDARFVFSQDDEASVLRPAEFHSSGGLKNASERGAIKLALDTTRSRLVIESQLTRSVHSFLVPPNVTHFAMAGSRSLALAGPDHLYWYGQHMS